MKSGKNDHELEQKKTASSKRWEGFSWVFFARKQLVNKSGREKVVIFEKDGWSFKKVGAFWQICSFSIYWQTLSKYLENSSLINDTHALNPCRHIKSSRTDKSAQLWSVFDVSQTQFKFQFLSCREVKKQIFSSTILNYRLLIFLKARCSIWYEIMHITSLHIVKLMWLPHKNRCLIRWRFIIYDDP